MQLSAQGLASSVLAGIVSVASVGSAAQAVPEERAGTEDLFLRAKRVVVRPGEVLEDAAVLVRDGKIVGVGTDLAQPEGARVLEAEVVCAGFVDPWGALGLDPGVLVDGGTSASSRAADAIDLYSNDHLRLETLRAGVTSVRVQSGVNARVGGVGAVLRLDPEASRDEAIVLEDANVAMTIGVQSTGGAVQVVGLASATQPMDPFDRVAELDRLVQSLESAEKYLLDKVEYGYELEEWQKKIAEAEEQLEKDFKKAKKDREKEIEEAKEKGKEHKDKRYKEDRKPKAPKYDPDEEVMARVVNGELPLVVQAHRAAEIRGLLDGTRRFERLRLILAGGADAAPFAEALAERRIPVLVWPAPLGEGAPDGLERQDLALAARLSEAGVPVLLGSGGASSGASRDLPLLASLAIGHGLDREKAFEALTVGAARAFDINDRVGSVERGKDADLLLLDGEPLEATTRVMYVVTGGRVVITPED